MAKRVAVVAVNPVNGFGLFQYLEAFYENNIPYTVFAVSDTTNIKTNSGLPVQVQDVIANLKGKEDSYDALVFACGDAVPVFNDNADKQYNKDLMAVIKAFGEKNKIMIGHCGAGLFFEFAGIAAKRKVSVHPFVKSLIKNAVATDEPSSIDGNFHTAQTENSIGTMIDEVVKVLK